MHPSERARWHAVARAQHDDDTPSSPILPRRIVQADKAKIVHALRARANVMRNIGSGEPTTVIGRTYLRLADEYHELADRIRDGGPLAQRAYYGARIPLREYRDNRKDRTS